MKFGEIIQEVGFNNGKTESDIVTIHDNRIVKKVKRFTKKVKLNGNNQLKEEISALLSDVESGNTLDFTVEVKIDQDGKAKWINITTTDPCSKFKM